MSELTRMYFSYSQFLVFDRAVSLPGCLWTAAHTAQGFARRESAVCFSTPIEFGHARIRVAIGAFLPDDRYERVVAVPFEVVSGQIIVGGPEEDDKRIVGVTEGYYRLVAAQHLVGEEQLTIDLFWERSTLPLRNSAILVADRWLSASGDLLETAEIA